jgi:hypothetical protein
MGGGSGGNSLEIVKSVMVHVCCASRAEILVGAPRAVVRRVAAATKLVVNFILIGQLRSKIVSITRIEMLKTDACGGWSYCIVLLNFELKEDCGRSLY